MDHLFNSAFAVKRQQLTVVDGRPTLDWVQATDDDPDIDQQLHFLKARLDMNFVRPGKDIPAAVNAGTVPERIGVLFTYPYSPIKAGDRIEAIPNVVGLIPVPGTYEIRVIPDIAQDYATGHHIEVQVLEVNQELVDKFPDDDDLDVDL